MCERGNPEPRDAARDNQFLNIATLEPRFAHGSEAPREAQHFLVLLVEPELLRCHLYLLGQLYFGHSRPKQTEPAEFAEAFVQADFPQLVAPAEGPGPDLLQNCSAEVELFQPSAVLEGTLGDNLQSWQEYHVL